MLKLLLILPALSVAITRVLEGGAEAIVLAAAAAAGALWLSQHVVRPAIRTLGRTAQAVDSLERLPGWMDVVEEHVTSLDERVALLEGTAKRTHNAAAATARDLGVAVRE